MIRALLAGVSLLAMTGGAHADPVFTPLFTYLFAGTALAGTSIAGVSVVSIASTVATIATGLGLTMLLSPRPKTPTPENGSIAVQSPLPFRIFGYGTARVAGNPVFKEQEANFLGYIAALNGHEVSAIQSIYLNDDAVTLGSGAGFAVSGALSGPVQAGADGRYANSTVLIDTRKGVATETAYPAITQVFSDIWTTAARGDGVASLMMVCSPVSSSNFQKVYPYGAPAPSAVIDQYKLFDPRDAAQRWYQPATWTFSKNPALAILHYECFSEYGPKRNYVDAIRPVLDQWIQAANDCDDEVALKAGGFENRYELGGWITTESDRKTVLQTMLTACDGWLVERGDGTLILKVGKFAAPTVSLTDDDILGFYIQRGIASEDRVNQATAKYTSPACNYTSVETTPLIDTADQTARPGPPRTAQLDLPWVQSTGQASRLLKREMLKQGERTRGKLTLRLSGINAAFERWIQVNSNTIPRLSNMVIENKKAVISLMNQTVEIDFVGSGSYIEAYTPATDESAPPQVPQRPATVGMPVPANVSAVAEEIADATGVLTTFMAVSWDGPTRNGSNWILDYRVSWRIKDIGGGTAGDWQPQTFTQPPIAAGRVSVTTGVVPTGTTLQVKVQSISSGASLSTDSAIVEVSTIPADLAPPAPTLLTATKSGSDAALSCKNPNSPRFSAIRFYRASHSAPFATATAIGSAIYGSPNATTTYTDAAPGAGTWDYFAVSLSAGGAQSDPAGPAAVTI